MVCSSARKEAFTDEVYLEGFTIEGGKYNDTNEAKYAPGCGAGVYINDPNARMRYCTVRFCNQGMKEIGSIKPRGGGIYCKNGQTEGNLVYDCSAYQGGGIYIDEAGFITRSMVTNCSAYQGAGVYLKGDPNNSAKAYYQILATSVISNNTSTRNGAVYLDGHGLVINNTIVNNYTTNTKDDADEMSSNTGGVYIKERVCLPTMSSGTILCSGTSLAPATLHPWHRFMQPTHQKRPYSFTTTPSQM